MAENQILENKKEELTSTGLDNQQDAISQSSSSIPINIGTAIAKGESAFETGERVAKDALKKLGATGARLAATEGFPPRSTS